MIFMCQPPPLAIGSVCKQRQFTYRPGNAIIEGGFSTLHRSAQNVSCFTVTELKGESSQLRIIEFCTERFISFAREP